MPDGIPEEDTERQVQDSDSIDSDEPQRSRMRYVPGELLVPRPVNKYGTAVWDHGMVDVVGHIPNGEFATALHEDDYGWVRVVTCRGIVGIIHRTNLMRPVQSQTKKM